MDRTPWSLKGRYDSLRERERVHDIYAEAGPLKCPAAPCATAVVCGLTETVVFLSSGALDGRMRACATVLLCFLARGGGGRMRSQTCS